MIVTKQNYPAVFAAFLEIAHDADAVQSGTAEPTQFDVPGFWKPSIELSQTALARLSAEDFTTFCIGEEAEQAVIAKKFGIQPIVSSLLNAFFQEL